MKRIIISIFIMTGLVLVFVPVIRAATVDYVVSVTVPAATTVNIKATKVNAATDAFGSAVTALNFDPLTFDTVNGIYLPSSYYAIDVGASGGAGSPSVIVTYTEGAKPVGQTHGLGWKTTASFVKVTGTPGAEVQTDMTSHGPQKLLKNLTGENITSTELSGGFLRLYIGIFAGDVPALVTAGGEVFSNSDKAGAYNGTLTITGTVL